MFQRNGGKLKVSQSVADAELSGRTAILLKCLRCEANRQI